MRGLDPRIQLAPEITSVSWGRRGGPVGAGPVMMLKNTEASRSAVVFREPQVPAPWLNPQASGGLYSSIDGRLAGLFQPHQRPRKETVPRQGLASGGRLGTMTIFCQSVTGQGGPGSL